MNSDASDLVNGYFNIIVLEEVALTGVSIFDIRTGCYASWDASIYCIGEVDRIYDRYSPKLDCYIFPNNNSGEVLLKVL